MQNGIASLVALDTDIRKVFDFVLFIVGLQVGQADDI